RRRHAGRADDQLRATLLLEGGDGLLAGGDRILSEQMLRVGKPAQDRALDLDVPGEQDKRLAGVEEVVDPRDPSRELAPRGEALERRQLSQALGPQGCGDLRIKRAQIQRLAA